MEKLSKNLKQFATDKQMSIAAISRATGIPPQTLNNWLAGQEPRSISQVKKLADYFEVSLDYLCFGITRQRSSEGIDGYSDEINAGVFEVVLRKVKSK